MTTTGGERDDEGRFHVAVFDLDGTLVDRRSMARFARRLVGPLEASRAAGHSLVRILPHPSSTAFKRSVWHELLAGRAESDVRAAGTRFADELATRRLRPDMAQQLDGHRAAGHGLVLVTAALDVYARPLAERLGFDEAIATTVVVRDGRCTGELLAADLKGRSKVAALRRWLGPRESVAHVHAYGDSGNDEDLLEYARSTSARAGRSRAR